MEIAKTSRFPVATTAVAGGALARSAAGAVHPPQWREESAARSGFAAGPAPAAEPVEEPQRVERVPMAGAAYDGLGNRARIAIRAYLAQQETEREQAKNSAHRLFGIDYYV